MYMLTVCPEYPLPNPYVLATYAALLFLFTARSKGLSFQILHSLLIETNWNHPHLLSQLHHLLVVQLFLHNHPLRIVKVVAHVASASSQQLTPEIIIPQFNIRLKLNQIVYFRTQIIPQILQSIQPDLLFLNLTIQTLYFWFELS